MRVLGVDPGSRTTGWGLIGGTAGRPRFIEAGVIRLRGSSFAQRLAGLQAQLHPLVGRLEPTAAAVEAPFHGVNPRSALQLAHARGVILATLAASGLEVAEYDPARVKQSVTGNGRAPKEQVRTMVHRLLGTAATAGADIDVSDALAVALCHVGCLGFWSRAGRPPSRPWRAGGRRP